MKTSPLQKKETTKLGVFPNPAMSKKDLEKSQPQTRPFSQKGIHKNQRIQRTHWQPNHKHLSYTYGFPTTRRLHSGLIKSEGLMCTADPEKLWKQHESVPKKLDTCVTCFTIQEFHIYYQYMSSVCVYVTSYAAALQMISFDWHHKKEIHSIYIYIYILDYTYHSAKSSNWTSLVWLPSFFQTKFPVWTLLGILSSWHVTSESWHMIPTTRHNVTKPFWGYRVSPYFA